MSKFDFEVSEFSRLVSKLFMIVSSAGEAVCEAVEVGIIGFPMFFKIFCARKTQSKVKMFLHSVEQNSKVK